MHKLARRRFIGAAVLLLAVSLPTQVNAFFWSGPGCLVANMLGMGSVGGGLHFSVGGATFGSGAGPAPRYGYRRAYPPPPGPPRPAPRQQPAMSSSSQAQSNASRTHNMSEANTWRGGITPRKSFEAGDTGMAPPNRWSHGR